MPENDHIVIDLTLNKNSNEITNVDVLEGNDFLQIKSSLFNRKIIGGVGKDKHQIKKNIHPEEEILNCYHEDDAKKIHSHKESTMNTKDNTNDILLCAEKHNDIKKEEKVENNNKNADNNKNDNTILKTKQYIKKEQYNDEITCPCIELNTLNNNECKIIGNCMYIKGQCVIRLDNISIITSVKNSNNLHIFLKDVSIESPIEIIVSSKKTKEYIMEQFTSSLI